MASFASSSNSQDLFPRIPSPHKWFFIRLSLYSRVGRPYGPGRLDIESFLAARNMFSQFFQFLLYSFFAFPTTTTLNP